MVLRIQGNARLLLALLDQRYSLQYGRKPLLSKREMNMLMTG